MIICKECGIEVFIQQRNTKMPDDEKLYFCFCCEYFLKVNEVAYTK